MASLLSARLPVRLCTHLSVLYVILQPKKINAKEMTGLVERLNDSSRQKQLFIMRIQQRQIASEVLAWCSCLRAVTMHPRRRFAATSMQALRGLREAGPCAFPHTAGYLRFTLWLSVLCMRSKAKLAASVSLRLARLPRTGSSAQRSCRLRSTRAAAPVLLAYAEVTKT